MIIHSVEQGSRAWCELRAGIPTSSGFSRILTPTGKRSSQADAYMFDLIAERYMGRPLDNFVTAWMERGHHMEEEAVRYYALQKDCDPVKVGFVTNDAGTVGASPDRLVGESGLLEIKCPSPGVHVQYLFHRSPDKAHRPQMQGQLLVTGREWNDILSYYPGLPEALVRVEPDREYQALLREALEEFVKTLEGRYAELVDVIGEPEGQVREKTEVEHLRESLIALNSE
jgi:hypothetical protein